jgi:hypothetical protein
VRDDLQVDTVRVHVGKPFLAEVAQLAADLRTPAGQRARAGRRGQAGRQEVLFERNRPHPVHCARRRLPPA